MKALRFLPLAFLADVHGFVLFAPYLLLVMTVALLAHWWARRRARLSRLAQPVMQPRGPVVELSAAGETSTVHNFDAALSALT